MGCASSTQNNEEIFDGIHSTNPDHGGSSKTNGVDVDSDLNEVSLLINKAKNIIDNDCKISNDDLSTTWNKIDTILSKYNQNKNDNTSKKDENKPLNASTTVEIKFTDTNDDNEAKINDNLIIDLTDEKQAMKSTTDIVDKIINVSEPIQYVQYILYARYVNFV